MEKRIKFRLQDREVFSRKLHKMLISKLQVASTCILSVEGKPWYLAGSHHSFADMF